MNPCRQACSGNNEKLLINMKTRLKWSVGSYIECNRFPRTHTNKNDY